MIRSRAVPSVRVRPDQLLPPIKFTDHDLDGVTKDLPRRRLRARGTRTCPSRAKAGGIECHDGVCQRPCTFMSAVIDSPVMTDPRSLDPAGPSPWIVDPNDGARSAQDSSALAHRLCCRGPCRRPFQTTRGSLDHRFHHGAEIRPAQPHPVHIASATAIDFRVASLAGFGPFGGSISMPLRRRCSVVQATASGRRVAPHLAARSSTVLAPAGKQYDVCLFPGRAEEQSPVTFL